MIGKMKLIKMLNLFQPIEFSFAKFDRLDRSNLSNFESENSIGWKRTWILPVSIIEFFKIQPSLIGNIFLRKNLLFFTTSFCMHQFRPFETEKFHGWFTSTHWNENDVKFIFTTLVISCCLTTKPKVSQTSTWNCLSTLQIFENLILRHISRQNEASDFSLVSHANALRIGESRIPTL